MSAKIKNILIIVVVVILLLLGYYFFFNKKDTGALLNSASNSTTNTTGELTAEDKDLLNILLNMKNIKIDNTLLSTSVFSNLKETSINLIPDGKEGRINPFAPIGSDQIDSNISSVSNTGLLPVQPTLDAPVGNNILDSLIPKASENKSGTKTN